ncbi:hypothetical protein K504DRAFT_497591 [Pleomassaria siparia CBS 279.74]|uniref:Transmembrane protein n=1 Tax=Pleomassaria siparia CBS 279.74 TaxID=1314801 RepID=A0A6G1KSA2_9PLEO|nr:hypothetical protein K504DRAFT_497591 [Pleomassaria siparia CBS 279.74]
MSTPTNSALQRPPPVARSHSQPPWTQTETVSSQAVISAPSAFPTELPPRPTTLPRLSIRRIFSQRFRETPLGALGADAQRKRMNVGMLILVLVLYILAAVDVYFMFWPIWFLIWIAWCVTLPFSFALFAGATYIVRHSSMGNILQQLCLLLMILCYGTALVTAMFLIELKGYHVFAVRLCGRVTVYL